MRMTEPSWTLCGLIEPCGKALASFNSTRANSCVPPRAVCAATIRLTMSELRMPASMKGVTTTTRPSAGTSAAVVRSDLHQRTPVKYSSVDPASTRNAAILSRCIRPWSFARRARCSSGLIGATPEVIGLRPVACGGSAASSLAPAAVTAAAPAAAPSRARLETLMRFFPGESKSGCGRGAAFAAAPLDERSERFAHARIERRRLEGRERLAPARVRSLGRGLCAIRRPGAVIAPVGDERGVEGGTVALHGVCGGEEMPAGPHFRDRLDADLLGRSEHRLEE